ncbi:MAG: Gfo/Idh/MocA family oxidoreductase, partial [Bacteroidetes bacterium]|nr:Gfo/Idh/MocA family oxidoreductase [Bacteroidota bacterium]
MEKISTCIVGLGRAGRFDLDSILKLNQFELLYIVDPVNKRKDINNDLPKNVVFTSSLDEAVSNPHLDAVIVSSPTHSHFDYIIQALNNGKHVFTEKPLGKSSEEIIKCFELAANKNLALYVGFQRRYDVNFNELKAQITGLGAPRLVRISSRDNPKPTIEYLKNSGNIFHDMLIHDFDMLIYLLGERIQESFYVLS